jgi:hypothetical protein
VLVQPHRRAGLRAVGAGQRVASAPRGDAAVVRVRALWNRHVPRRQRWAAATGETLHDLDLSADYDNPDKRRWAAANQPLVDAGVYSVKLNVDENGHYAFAATYDPARDPDKVREALRTHIREVFGGTFTVHPINVKSRRINPGDASLKAYNGMRDVGGTEDQEGLPRGSAELQSAEHPGRGLWNDMLSPAVFLEQTDFMEKFFVGQESQEFLRSVADVIAP